jgi:hypothetical protein
MPIERTGLDSERAQYRVVKMARAFEICTANHHMGKHREAPNLSG